MLRSSLGFHTMSMIKLLFDDDASQLIKDFKRYSKETGLIKIFPVNGDYNITYFREDRGLKWMIRWNEWSMKFNGCLIEVKINPKILGGIQDYVTAATFQDMETAIRNFNLEAARISPLLTQFTDYSLKRIDYCVNFDLNELVSGCSSELIMDLIKRSDIPLYYKEYMEYDSTAHRMKSKPGSFYLMNKSTNINCYSKFMDLQQRSEDREKRGLTPIPQKTLDFAQGIIRFEVQCKYRKMYVASNRAKKSGNRNRNKYETLLSDEVCKETINYYYNKIIGKGNWYTLQVAIQKIKQQRFHKQKENRLIDALQLVNQCRSLAKAKALYKGNELKAFKQTLNDLSLLGISPVTIPKDKGIKEIPNLLYTYYDKIQKENMQKQIAEFQSDCLHEYIKKLV